MLFRSAVIKRDKVVTEKEKMRINTYRCDVMLRGLSETFRNTRHRSLSLLLRTGMKVRHVDVAEEIEGRRASRMLLYGLLGR